MENPHPLMEKVNPHPSIENSHHGQSMTQWKTHTRQWKTNTHQ